MLRQREPPPQRSSIEPRDLPTTAAVSSTRRRRRVPRQNQKTGNLIKYYFDFNECSELFICAMRQLRHLIPTTRIRIVSACLIICFLFWIYIDSCVNHYDTCYFSPIYTMNHRMANETLLRLQSEYDQSNLYTTGTSSSSHFPIWPSTVDSVVRSNSPPGSDTFHSNLDYFNDLIGTIHRLLRPQLPNQNHRSSSSQLPYDTQPSFQTIYIITCASQRNKTTTNEDTSQLLLLYKYTLPNTQTQMVQDRARYMESFLLQMLSVLNHRDKTTNPSIHSSLSNTMTGIDMNDRNFRRAIQKFGGILYVVSYTDSQFCCDQTTTTSTPTTRPLYTVSNSVIPIFTLSAPIHCSFAFPIPTYETILFTKKLETSQRKRIIPIQFMDRYMKYPWWYRRYSQAVWRGSPTGLIQMDQNTRWKLCRMSQQYPQWLDAKFVGNTQRWPILAKNNNSVYVGTHISIRDMQQYRAIIDVDGNSWSSRFGALLCQSSVVLKVQPKYVDYFYPTLQPWKHYIPVREDLSDLLERIQFATSIHHTAIVQRIIYNANEWCHHHMTTLHLMEDMMSILDTYASKIMLPSNPQNHHNAHYNSNHSNSTLLIPLLLQQYEFTPVVVG
jgi:Glycosyl transferase family 90